MQLLDDGRCPFASRHQKMLRQTVAAMVKGVVQNEHESEGEATVQVIPGRVRLPAGDATKPG
jgi:hypothetical protein